MASQKENTKITVELPGRDWIELRYEGDLASPRIRLRGCTELLDLMRSMRGLYGVHVEQWPLPQGAAHSEILVRELILKARGEWNYPHKEAMVCNCRAVSLKTVDQAVVAGAHTTAMVSRQTSASTNCGTCRDDVQKIIDYRLHAGLVQASSVDTAKKKSA